LNELSLFTGAGGGLLGTKLLGWKAIGYVEKEPFCQKVIRQRIADGILDAAPIFGDIRKFISEGYAASYTGLVDVLTAGFPCQPFSVAGKRKQADDERNMWPATDEVIGIVKPRFVLLENVPGVREYLPVVVRDLRRCGYEVQHPLQLGADDVGAPHRRKRVWIMAYTTERQDNGRKRGNMVAAPEVRESFNAAIDACGEDVADAETKGLERQDAARDTCPDGRALQFAGRNWWAVEPDVGRVAHGVASRVDRLKAIGNGQVPLVVATAWRILMDT
jgi:DNA (cytosine-5)-methyltransferase 1